MNKILHPVLCLLFLTISHFSKSQVAVVVYMKVKPGNENKYLEVQKSWKKLHELRLKTGNILTWALYRPMFTGLDYQWQYVTVTLYKDIAAYKNAHWSDSL